MIYGYPYYATTYKGLSLGENSYINDTNIDANGDGFIGFGDYDQFFDETDFYEDGFLIDTSTIFNNYIVESASYDRLGNVIAFEKSILGEINTSGWILLDGSNGFDRLDYIETDYTPSFRSQLNYTSSDGLYGYYSDIAGLYGFLTAINQAFKNPYTGTYSFSAVFERPTEGDVVRTISDDGRSVTEQTQTYVRQLEYGEDRRLLHETRFTETGVSFDLKHLANGDVQTTNFGTQTVASVTVTHSDGSQSETYFNTLGLTAKTVERDADGSADVFLFRDGVVTDHNTYSAGGKLAITDKIAADGSHTVTAHQTGQTLEGGMTDDTLFDFGNTTFTFNPGFGKDTIRGFDVDGLGQDVIALSSAFDPSGFEFSQVGSDTHIQITPDDEIILAGVSVTSLPQLSILFV